MGYVEQLLSKGETINVRSRQHWMALIASILINAFILIVVMVLRIVIGNLFVSILDPDSFLWSILNIATALAILYPIARLGWDVAQWWSEEYIVTTRRVIETAGIVNKHTVDSALEKVNDVVLVQSVFGRVLSYGDLQIVTGSDVGVNRLQRLRDPIGFKTAMLDAKHKLSDEDYRGSDEVADADVPKLIAELDNLRRQGMISDAEFNEKKAKLLSQL